MRAGSRARVSRDGPPQSASAARRPLSGSGGAGRPPRFLKKRTASRRKGVLAKHVWPVNVLIVVASAMLPVVLVSLWVHGIVTNTDRYVSTVAAVADQEAVQKAVEDRVGTLVLEAIDANRSHALPGVARSVVEDVVRRATTRVVEGREFATAWRAANRAMHEEMLDVLRGSSSVVDRSGRVTIRLSTLVTRVLAIVDKQYIVRVDELPDAEASFTLITASDLSRARSAFRVVDPLGVWLPAIWLLLAVTSAVVAPSKRDAVYRLGLGSGLSLIAVEVALTCASHVLIGAGPASDQTVVSAVWSALSADLRTTLEIPLLVAGGITAAMWVSRRGSTRRRDPASCSSLGRAGRRLRLASGRVGRSRQSRPPVSRRGSVYPRPASWTSSLPR